MAVKKQTKRQPTLSTAAPMTTAEKLAMAESANQKATALINELTAVLNQRTEAAQQAQAKWREERERLASDIVTPAGEVVKAVYIPPYDMVSWLDIRTTLEAVRVADAELHASLTDYQKVLVATFLVGMGFAPKC